MRSEIERNERRKGAVKQNTLPYTGCPLPSINENIHLKKQHRAPDGTKEMCINKNKKKTLNIHI